MRFDDINHWFISLTWRIEPAKKASLLLKLLRAMASCPRLSEVRISFVPGPDETNMQSRHSALFQSLQSSISVDLHPWKSLSEYGYSPHPWGVSKQDMEVLATQLTLDLMRYPVSACICWQKCAFLARCLANTYFPSHAFFHWDLCAAVSIL